jgi:dGTPase
MALNEALAEAIALGHDVGHTPFGHTGEEALSPYFPPLGWHHAAQSVRLYEVLEDLNLSWEVRDGIRAHTWKITPPPVTPEALCVRYADRIAYLTHDALDAVRAGILTPDAFPAAMRARFGPPGSPWIGGMIDAVIAGSLTAGTIRMSDDVLADMHELRGFMFERVYLAPSQRDHHRQAIEVIRQLMDHHLEHPEDLPPTYRDNDADRVTQAADYVAGMTDRFALRAHERLFGETGMDDPAL